LGGGDMITNQLGLMLFKSDALILVE